MPTTVIVTPVITLLATPKNDYTRVQEVKCIHVGFIHGLKINGSLTLPYTMSYPGCSTTPYGLPREEQIYWYETLYGKTLVETRMTK